MQSRGETGQSRGRIWECFRQHEKGARIAPFALAQGRLGAVGAHKMPAALFKAIQSPIPNRFGGVKRRITLQKT